LGSGDAVRKAIASLPPDQITADLKAVVDYVAKLPAADGKVAVAGFCWGGSQSFRLATHLPELRAAFVFYGTGPEEASAFEGVRAPVYGFYGGNDARVNATIPRSEEGMKKAGKRYEPVTYEGAGHGFMRAGEEPGAGEANKRARDEAWKRMKELLKKL
jgi:carboxymethylenebutenolidase